MEAQEIFDKVVARLRDGYGESINSVGCRYRDANGVGCAVGCLLTDEEYNPKMEGMTVLGKKHYLPVRLLPHIELLIYLQNAHDRERYWEGKQYAVAGEEFLVEISKLFGLTYTKP